MRPKPFIIPALAALSVGAVLLVSRGEPNATEAADLRHGASTERSHKAARGDAAKAARSEEARINERLKELEGLSGEAFLSALREGLQSDQPLEMAVLGKWRGDLDVEPLLTLLLDHFWHHSWEDALAQFSLIEPNQLLADRLLGHLLEAVSLDDPEKARQWLLANQDVEGGPQGAFILGKAFASSGSISENFSLINETDASENLRRNLIQGYLEQWVQKDFNATFEFVSQLPADPILDEAIYRLTTRAARIDPKQSIPWAESITDSGLRRSALLEVADAWRDADQVAYLEWKSGRERDDLSLELP